MVAERKLWPVKAGSLRGSWRGASGIPGSDTVQSHRCAGAAEIRPWGSGAGSCRQPQEGLPAPRLHPARALLTPAEKRAASASAGGGRPKATRAQHLQDRCPWVFWFFFFPVLLRWERFLATCCVAQPTRPREETKIQRPNHGGAEAAARCPCPCVWGGGSATPSPSWASFTPLLQQLQTKGAAAANLLPPRNKPFPSWFAGGGVPASPWDFPHSSRGGRRDGAPPTLIPAVAAEGARVCLVPKPGVFGGGCSEPRIQPGAVPPAPPSEPPLLLRARLPAPLGVLTSGVNVDVCIFGYRVYFRNT